MLLLRLPLLAPSPTGPLPTALPDGARRGDGEMDRPPPPPPRSELREKSLKSALLLLLLFELALALLLTGLLSNKDKELLLSDGSRTGSGVAGEGERADNTGCCCGGGDACGGAGGGTNLGTKERAAADSSTAPSLSGSLESSNSAES